MRWAVDEDKLTFIVLARELVDPTSSNFHLDPAPMVSFLVAHGRAVPSFKA